MKISRDCNSSEKIWNCDKMGNIGENIKLHYPEFTLAPP